MAAKATPEQVAEFITTIGFGQYAKFFLDDEMDGEMMLDAKDSDLPDQVDSRLHQVKIIALFRSTFTGTKKTRFVISKGRGSWLLVTNNMSLRCENHDTYI